MTIAQKYNFDIEFSETGEILSAPDIKKNFSLEEVETIKAEAQTEGRTSVEAQSAQQSAATLADIAQVATQILQKIEGELHKVRADALSLALIAARKLASHALNTFPSAELDALLSECIEEVPNTAQLCIWVPEAFQSEMEEKITTLCAAHNFEGQLKIYADATMQAGAYKIDWGKGGIERDRTSLEETIDTIITQHLAANEARLDEQPDLFSFTPPQPAARNYNEPGLAINGKDTP